MQNLMLIALLAFGDMTSQNFPQEKGTESSNSAIHLQKTGLTFYKMSFMSIIVLLDPKLTPPRVNFSNFQGEENFSFSKFL